MRTHPKYSQMRLIHEDSGGVQTLIYCNEVTRSKSIDAIFGAPIIGSSSRFITDAMIDIAINDKIIMGDDTMRVTAIPESNQAGGLNTRRGQYNRRDTVFETS